MKTFVIFSMLVAAICFCQPAQSQVLKKTKKETTKKIDKKVDEGINSAVKKLGGLLGKNKEQEQKQDVNKNEVKENTVTEEPGKQPNETQITDPQEPLLKWSKYDFVPGDNIIFEDNLDGEENGEFPSRWDLVNGTVENAVFGGENIIMFRGGDPMIVPYLKNSDIDYLPEVFTIEFDLYMNNHNSFQVYFYDRKNQRTSSDYSDMTIDYQQMILSPASSRIPDNGSIEGKWAHIAIAYTDGKIKGYIDETRLINIPHLAFDPMGISLRAYHGSDQNQFFIKNFRLAEGGVKYYDRFLQDGKIVSNGIRFDTGKSTLKPESMGVVNEIYKMLNDHPELSISIEGHTDSDGDETLNQTLSEERALTVLNRLVKMGISGDRLSSKGFGESAPVVQNDTPEHKAENRRVEFVKL